MSVAIYGGGAIGGPSVIVKNTLASGADSGSFSAGAWRTREMNDLVHNEIGASLAANRLFLPIGRYYAQVGAIGRKCDAHQVQLWHVPGALGFALFLGECHAASGTNGGQTMATASGYFDLAVANNVEVQHRGSTSQSSRAFGLETGFGNNWSNLVLNLWKVA